MTRNAATPISAKNMEAIAIRHYGSIGGLLTVSQMVLPGVGAIDRVLAHHAPLSLAIEDFVLICNEAGRRQPVKRLQLAAICKFWGVKSYILVSEHQYDELTSGDGGSSLSYNPDHFVRLVVCRASQAIGLSPVHQFASVAGDAAAVLQDEGINLPSREEFIRRLSNRLRREMLSSLRALIMEKEADYILSRNFSIA
jgi:hypothetical protein